MIALAPVTPGGIVRGDAAAGAEFSPCDRYRFRLWRVFDPLLVRAPRMVAWVMLNPSTADESQLDPTLRRCRGFAQAWGFDGFYVANVFALRSTNPRALLEPGDPVGPGNDDAIDSVARASELVIVAWGSHRAAKPRAERVGRILERSGRPVKCLRYTPGGEPNHPLYVPRATKPLLWFAR